MNGQESNSWISILTKLLEGVNFGESFSQDLPLLHFALPPRPVPVRLAFDLIFECFRTNQPDPRTKQDDRRPLLKAVEDEKARFSQLSRLKRSKLDQLDDQI